MKFALLSVCLVILFFLNIFCGSVHIPFDKIIDILFLSSGSDTSPASFIILHSRFPQALTALFAGSTLAISGLLLQTTFRNPLAGPSILGISNGASLGVALVLLLPGINANLAIESPLAMTATTVIAAFIGSLTIMGLLIVLSQILHSNLLLLISGIMIGYLSSSIISLLNFLSDAEGVQNFVIWGMGNFSSVSDSQLPFYVTLSIVGLFLSILLIKPLNIMLLGEKYAINLGLNIKYIRNILLFITGLLTATSTAFCGPIAFVGLAVPHISRLLFKSDDHLKLLPATILLGSCVTLLCNLLSVALTDGIIIPINAITPLIGAPIVIYVILHRTH